MKKLTRTLIASVAAGLMATSAFAMTSAEHKTAKDRISADYKVAKEKCDDQAGNDKDVCVKEAKAVEGKALADGKMGQEIGEAKADANAAKRDADYKVAVEKCDAMAGDAKAGCLDAAKASFGKS